MRRARAPAPMATDFSLRPRAYVSPRGGRRHRHLRQGLHEKCALGTSPLGQAPLIVNRLPPTTYERPSAHPDRPRATMFGGRCPISAATRSLEGSEGEGRSGRPVPSALLTIREDVTRSAHGPAGPSWRAEGLTGRRAAARFVKRHVHDRTSGPTRRDELATVVGCAWLRARTPSWPASGNSRNPNLTGAQARLSRVHPLARETSCPRVGHAPRAIRPGPAESLAWMMSSSRIATH